MDSFHVNGNNLTIILILTRQSSGYILTTIIPNCFLVLIAIMTFALPPNDLSDKVMVTLTLFVVAASILAQTAASLPHTSYVKCIDMVFIATIASLLHVFTIHVSVSWYLRRCLKNQIFVKTANSTKLDETFANQRNQTDLLNQNKLRIMKKVQRVSLFFLLCGLGILLSGVLSYCTGCI